MHQQPPQQPTYNQDGRQFTFNYSSTQQQPAVVDPSYYRSRGGGPAFQTGAAPGPANGQQRSQNQDMYQFGGQQQVPNQYLVQQQPSTGYYSGGTQNGHQQQVNPGQERYTSLAQGSQQPVSHANVAQAAGYASSRSPPQATTGPASRQIHQPAHKRQKPLDEDDEDEADYDDDDQDVVPDPAGRSSLRPQGACAPCKHLKIKCVFESRRSPACKNCIKRNKDCTIPERRPRKAPPKRDELIKSIRDKDALILQLIEQLEDRKSSTVPLSLSLTSDTALAAKESSTPTDPVAKEALQKELVQREKETQEWLKKAKATIEKSNAMDFGLLGGTANPVLSDGQDSDDSSDYAVENSGSGGESDQDVSLSSPQAATGPGRNLRRGASLVSSQSKKSGSGSNNTNKASALPAGAPLGLIAKMGNQLTRKGSHARSRGSSPRVTDGASAANGVSNKDGENGEEGEQYGVSNPEFFVPNSKPYNLNDGEKLEVPPILAKGIIGPKEVKELFEVYFDCMNLSTCILDPQLYTPEKTLYRSPFLFTVVCAIASRYHSSRTTLYPILMNCARIAAGTAIISGRKSLENCQAYILMSLYPMPARRWSEDRSWMYLGCAIRMATDLNLHHPPVLEGGEAAVTISTIMDTEWQSREILNRTRCWLGCFNADKAMSTQFGKPTTLREDWMFPLLQQNMSEGNAEWWCPTPFGWKFDIHLCAYSALLREISNFHEQVYSDPTNPTGLNDKIPFEKLTYEFDNRIETMAKEWFHRVDTHMDKNDPQCVFRKGLLQLEFYYNQLVALSFGFQHAFKRGSIQKDNTFLQRCYRAASRVVRIIVEELGQQKYMRYCPESHYIFSTFASAFLLKLLRPKFSSLLEVQQHHEILDLVQRLAITLNTIAMDDRHAPKLYSRFLQGLLKQAKKILAKGSQASSASSPASTAAMNNGSSPSPKMQSFAVGNMGMGMGNMYTPDMSSPSNASASYGYSMGDIPEQAAQNVGVPPGVYTFGDTPAFDMEGVQNTLPQSSWPHASAGPGDADTLMHMSLFGDQFWNEGLMPGFSWSDSTATHHGDNVVRNYSTMNPPDIQFSLDGSSTGYAPVNGGGVPVNQEGYYPPQQNPVQAFPTTHQQHPQQQQQQPQQQYQFQPNLVS